eukprot:1643918-Prymnesium_polylepis.2
MPALVRTLLVDGAEPADVPVSALLEALALPVEDCAQEPAKSSPAEFIRHTDVLSEKKRRASS